MYMYARKGKLRAVSNTENNSKENYQPIYIINKSY